MSPWLHCLGARHGSIHLASAANRRWLDYDAVALAVLFISI
jgi:hypothetical protein